jgi:hypothetical protein
MQNDGVEVAQEVPDEHSSLAAGRVDRGELEDDEANVSEDGEENVQQETNRVPSVCNQFCVITSDGSEPVRTNRTPPSLIRST